MPFFPAGCCSSQAFLGGEMGAVWKLPPERDQAGTLTLKQSCDGAGWSWGCLEVQWQHMLLSQPTTRVAVVKEALPRKPPASFGSSAPWLLCFIFTLNWLLQPERPGAWPCTPPTLSCFLTASRQPVPATFFFLQDRTFTCTCNGGLVCIFFLASLSALSSPPCWKMSLLDFPTSLLPPLLLEASLLLNFPSNY